MSRKKIVAGAIGALSAALVASVMFVSATGATETGGNSAFAIKAEGLVKIDAQPSVSGNDDKSVVDVPLSGLGHADVLHAEAGDGKAEARVAGLQLNGAAGISALTAKVIEAKCTSGGHGSSALVDAKIGDTPLKVEAPDALKHVELPGLVTVDLDKKVKYEDGSVTVTAISVKVHGVLALEIAKVHCGPGGATVTPQPPTCDKTCPALPTAPPAKPVEGHVAVTG